MADVPLRISALAATATTADGTEYAVLDKGAWAASRKILTSNYFGSRVLNGNIAVVDSVNGDAGTLGSFTKSYSGPELAQADATSGYCIDVYPGSFALSSSIGKAGVGWRFAAGVTLTMTDSGNAIGVIDDGGSAMTFTVSGEADLVLAGTVVAGQRSAVIHTRNASSNVVVECRSVTNNAGIGILANSSAIIGTAGTLKVRTRSIVSSHMYGAWWENGQTDVTTEDITCTGGAVPVLATGVGSPTGDFNLTALRISTTGLTTDAAAVLMASSAQTESKLWVNVQIVSSDRAAVGNQGGKLYVNAQKLAGCTGIGANTEGVVSMTAAAGPSWLTFQKVTGTYGYGIRHDGGTSFITSQQIEDLGNLTAGINVTGGTLTLSGVSVIILTGNGVNISGGTLRLINCRIDTTASASGFPINVTGGTLVIQSCVLLAAGSQVCVTAASGKTITNYGSVANTAKSSNITVNVQAILVDVNVI